MKSEAALYLGLSDEYFAAHVDVKPLPLRGTRATLYDVRDLDAWLDEMKASEGVQEPARKVSEPRPAASCQATEQGTLRELLAVTRRAKKANGGR